MTTPLILHGMTAQPQAIASADALDALVGVKQTLVQMFWSMQQGLLPDGSPRFTAFPVAIARQLNARGQMYVHTWAPADWVNKKAWTLPDVLAGKYDAYWIAQAKAIAALGFNVWIRLMHEMNGTWALYYTPNGADHVRLARYIIDLFRAYGALNITWVWCPNQVSTVASSSTFYDKVAAYYWGDDYVGWKATDCYNFGPSKGAPWQTFAQTFDLTYQTLRQIGDPTKPIFLTEFACHNLGGDKAAWLKDALATIPVKYPLVRAINHYGVPDLPSNWPLLATDGTAAAYAAGLTAGPYAVTGSFPMPPAIGTIQPLYAASWGDATSLLQGQVAVLQTRLGAANAELTEAGTTADTLATTGAEATAVMQGQLDDATGRLDTARNAVQDLHGALARPDAVTP